MSPLSETSPVSILTPPHFAWQDAHLEAAETSRRQRPRVL
jgi:hypothetical protein